MRKTLVRTISTSTISAFKLSMVDGQPTIENLEPVTVLGKVNPEQALKALKAEYGKNSAVQVGKIEVNEDTYEISVEDFVKYATKLEKAVSENA